MIKQAIQDIGYIPYRCTDELAVKRSVLIGAVRIEIHVGVAAIAGVMLSVDISASAWEVLPVG